MENRQYFTKFIILRKRIGIACRGRGRKQVADLLNDIFINSGLGFLSDLRMETDKTRILNAICSLEEKEYTDRQWRDAYSYLTGEMLSDTVADPKGELLKNLKK